MGRKRVSIKNYYRTILQRDVLKAIDDYFQELVKEYRRRKGKIQGQERGESMFKTVALNDGL